MSLTVVGYIAFDAIKTPFGERERALGGSAVHFSLAASFFTEVRPVGPVGDDFGEAEYEVLRHHGVVTDDIEHVARYPYLRDAAIFVGNREDVTERPFGPGLPGIRGLLRTVAPSTSAVSRIVMVPSPVRLKAPAWPPSSRPMTAWTTSSSGSPRAGADRRWCCCTATPRRRRCGSRSPP